ncbi:MAG TPA: MFS transporter [Phycisphaerales bacterium]|jgi:MFS family permease|nr:MFS transporter [Phycisphaerales bacterium]
MGEQRTALSRVPAASAAFRFVLTMGLVNLFADITYEGGAALNGPFLGSLGATAAAISIVAGLGECLGYAVRSLSGTIADRTGKHWPVTFVGYAINLLAVPAMALAPNWQVAAALVLAERIGRGIRKPTVEAMLSYTTGKVGRGWVYGLNTALDEIGATIGPLLMALVLFLKGSYELGFGLLIFSSVAALATLVAARIKFPLPAHLEEGGPKTAHGKHFSRAYWIYMGAGALFAAGLTSFELISFHLSARGGFSPATVPVLLALATAGGVVASLGFGRLYDRYGIVIIAGAATLSAMFSPLVFLGGSWVVVAGMFLWGIGYATQDTLIKALIAGVLPEKRRNTAFGIFYLGYGGGWLMGSIVMGLLYEHSRTGLIIFAVATQLASVPLFLLGNRSARRGQRR